MESTYELLLERVRRLSVLSNRRQLAFAAATVEHLARRMHERLEKESLDKVVDHTVKLLWEGVEGKGPPSSDLAEAQTDLKELTPPQDDEENEDIGYMLTAVLYACDLGLAEDPEESLQGLLYGVDNGVQFHTLQMLGDLDAATADSRVADEVQEEIGFHFGLLEKLERPDVELDRATLLG